MVVHLAVYCDGSISPSSMNDPITSNLGTAQVGRILVLMPEGNFGWIEQLKESLLNKRGNPDSVRSEYLAIERAVELCHKLGVEKFVVLSDCVEAVKKSNREEVSVIPNERFHYAGIFLERILSRAAYLRSSYRIVKNRSPLNPFQKELFELFNAPEKSFKLSESFLWMKMKTQLDMVQNQFELDKNFLEASPSHYHHHISIGKTPPT